MSYPQQYKDELLKAIASIDVEKVGQAIAKDRPPRYARGRKSEIERPYPPLQGR